METLTEAERITNEVYRDFVEHIDPSMEKESHAKYRNMVEVEAEGVWLTDVAGHRYLDAATAGGVFGLGYRHPRVIEAVTKQLQRMPCSSRGALNPLQGTLSRRLAEAMPAGSGLKYSHIAASGTEAVDIALKVSRLLTGRHHVVGTVGTFHGLSIADTCAGGISYLHEGIRPLIEGFSHVPYGDIAAMEKAVTDKTSAVILEPIQTATGVVMPPNGYLQRVRALCDQHGAVLIMDEIQTALRTGQFLACSHDNVVPDIVCLGKVMGGGVMPIGVAMWTARVQEPLTKKPFFNSTTFGGNQLSCAAALAVLDTVQHDNLLGNVQRQGARLRSELDRLAKTYPKVYRSVAGRGLMLAVELADIKLVASVIPRMTRKYRMLVLHAVFAIQRMRINPPLIIQDAEMTRVMEVLESVSAELAALPADKVQAVFDAWRSGNPLDDDF